MVRHKKSMYGKQVLDVSEFGKILSHPARISILSMLFNNGGMTAGAIFKEIPLARPTISQHLTVLLDQELIQAGRDKGRAFYAVNALKMKERLVVVQSYLQDMEGCLENLKERDFEMKEG